jgi:hypothetical protein
LGLGRQLVQRFAGSAAKSANLISYFAQNREFRKQKTD